MQPKLSDRDTCVCKKHSNIEFKFITLKKLLVLVRFNNLHDVIESLVCDIKAVQCMYSRCVSCKERSINYNFTTTKMEENVSWLEWCTVEVEYKKNDIIKKM